MVKKKINKIKKKVHAHIKRAKISVRRSAKQALKHVTKQRAVALPAFSALKQDVRELKTLETRVENMDTKFTKNIQSIHNTIHVSNKKTQEAIGHLAVKTANSFSAMNEHFKESLEEHTENLEEKIDETKSQLSLKLGNHERRLTAIEDAVMKMHDAVEALNDNWKEFTESLLVSAKKR